MEQCRQAARLAISVVPISAKPSSDLSEYPHDQERSNWSNCSTAEMRSLFPRQKLGSGKDIAVTLNHRSGQGARMQKVEVSTIHSWIKGRCGSGTSSQGWKSLMHSKFAISFMPVLQSDSAPRDGGHFGEFAKL